MEPWLTQLEAGNGDAAWSLFEQRYRRLILSTLDEPNQLAQWFGRVMTQPKYVDQLVPSDTPTDVDELVALLQEGEELLRSPGSRFAWRTLDDETATLFADGDGIACALPLARAGLDVIVKLHDRSLDEDPRYTGGIDWRARFAALIERLGSNRVAFADVADSSPLLAAADVMVTDHSSVGFEYLVLDRPLLVFDAPDLPRAARINPMDLKWANFVVAVDDESGAIVGTGQIKQHGDGSYELASIATVPASVSIPAGARAATFTITTRPVALETNFDLTASLGDQVHSVPIRVTP